MTKIAEPLLFEELAPSGPEATNDAGCAEALPTSVAATSVAATSVAATSGFGVHRRDVSRSGAHGHREPRLAAPRHAVVRRIKASSNGGSWEVSDAGFTQRFRVGSYLGFEARGETSAARGALYQSRPGRTYPKKTETHGVSPAGAVGHRGAMTVEPELAQPIVGTVLQRRFAAEDLIQAVAGYVFAAALLACSFFI